MKKTDVQPMNTPTDSQRLDHMSDYVDMLFTSDSFQHMEDNEIDYIAIDFYEDALRHYDYAFGLPMFVRPELGKRFRRYFANKVASVKLANRQRENDKEQGFTLVELMIVVVIIGILAAIAIPIFANQQREAINASVKSDVKNTNTGVARALVKRATASDVSAIGVDKTATAGNVIVVSGSWDNYLVKGVNPVTGFCYMFSSASGRYTECEGLVDNPSGDDGGNGGTVVTPPASNGEAREAARVLSIAISDCFEQAPTDDYGVTPEAAANCYEASGWDMTFDGYGYQPAFFQKDYSDGYVLHPAFVSNPNNEAFQYNTSTVRAKSGSAQAVVNSNSYTYNDGADIT